MQIVVRWECLPPFVLGELEEFRCMKRGQVCSYVCVLFGEVRCGECLTMFSERCPTDEEAMVEISAGDPQMVRHTHNNTGTMAYWNGDYCRGNKNWWH